MSIGGSPGTFFYNGVTFSERMKIESCSARPVPDGSGRTTKMVIHSITVRDIINVATSTTTDTTMAAIRRALTAQGKALVISGIGYGGLTVNLTENAKDVMWGPKPQELMWRPYGKAAAELIWKVEVAVPECSSATYSKALLEFVFTVAYDQDRAGYTTRTVSGYYVIAMSRAVSGDRALTDNADNYWDKVIPDMPEGFRREVTKRQLDETKAKMTFEFVDTEIGPNYLPVGVVDCKASHTVSSNGLGLVGWHGVIAADYEIARDFSSPKTYEHFLKLCNQRITDAKRNFIPLVQGSFPKNANISTQQMNGFLLPLKFSMGEPDIYGRPGARYSLEYLFYQNWFNILRASGLWLPVDNDWNIWRKSLANSATNPRGNAGMQFKNSDDLIIDLCLSKKTVTLKTGSDLPPQNRTLVGMDLEPDPPPPASSWLGYGVKMRVVSEDRTMIHKPLPQTRSLKSDGDTGLGTGLSGTTTAPPDLVQRIGSNMDYIILTGWAMRVCYDIEQPRLLKIAGRDVMVCNSKENGDFFDAWEVGNYGLPVNAAKWQQTYAVPLPKKGERPLSSGTLPALGTPTAPREFKLGSETMEPRLTTDGSVGL